MVLKCGPLWGGQGEGMLTEGNANIPRRRALFNSYEWGKEQET